MVGRRRVVAKKHKVTMNQCSRKLSNMWFKRSCLISLATEQTRWEKVKNRLLFICDSFVSPFKRFDVPPIFFIYIFIICTIALTLFFHGVQFEKFGFTNQLLKICSVSFCFWKVSRMKIVILKIVNLFNAVKLSDV